MELISSWEKEYHHFKEMVHEIGSFGNCYFSADSFRSQVYLKKMYRLEMESGLCYMLDRGTKWEMYICASEKASLNIPKLDKAIVANFVFRSSETKITPVEKLLLSNEMELNHILLDFLIGSPTLEKDDEYKALLERLGESGYTFGLLDSSSFSEAYQILDQCINSFDMVGYEEMDFPQMFSDKNIFCAMDGNEGKLCAVCILPSAFAGGLTAVIPEKRGLGLGKAIKYYSYYIAKNASNQHLWIAEDNIRNQDLMRQMGAINTGRILRQYVLKE